MCWVIDVVSSAVRIDDRRLRVDLDLEVGRLDAGVLVKVKEERPRAVTAKDGELGQKARLTKDRLGELT